MYKIVPANTPEPIHPQDTLADILAIKFDGNYAADADKFDRVRRFMLRRDITIQERWQADHHADVHGCGEDAPYPGDEYYRTWVDDNEDD